MRFATISRTIAVGLGLIIGASSAEAQKMYWTDVTYVKRANLDGTEVEVIATGGAGGIAVDVDGGKVYWGTGGSIRRANLDGTNEEVFIPNTNALAITIDPAGGTIYWTKGSQVWKANLDGTGVENIVSPGGGPAYGIGLDLRRGRVYWADNTWGKIMRAYLDGTGMEDVVTGLGHPWGVAIDATTRKMYWANERTGGSVGVIQRADLNGSNVEVLITTGVYRPHGIAIANDIGKLYWMGHAAGRIKRANLDGTAVEDVVVEGGELMSIAIDSSCTSQDPTDFDGDGIPDDCDPDIDNDGVLNGMDVCEYTPLGMAVDPEGRPKGDMNNDCVVDGLDIQFFVSQFLIW